MSELVYTLTLRGLNWLLEKSKTESDNIGEAARAAANRTQKFRP